MTTEQDRQDNEQNRKSERESKVEELLTRAVDAIYPSKDALEETLLSGRKLTAYMGIDPTAPDLHVGHVSQLHKLRRLQDLGHHVILLVGDFTAMIGDPTDKSAARQTLSREQVLANARTYKEQAAKILNFEDPNNPIELKFNSEWLGKMNISDIVELASQFTVQQMQERDMFKKRFAEGKPVSMNEFIYPMMQGWDSVMMDVDIEVGGSDQIFNMLVGRDLVRKHRHKEKFVIGGTLLADPDGRKIGKTEGNMITVLDEPSTMFQRVMMWGERIVPHALELCTDMPMEEIDSIRGRMESGELDPLEAKKILATAIVSSLHSPEAAASAKADYERISQSS